MKKGKRPTVDLTQFFTPEEIGPIQGVNLEGKWLIMRPENLRPEYHTRDNLLWKATGGFGCNPALIGRAVIVNSYNDGEVARYDRGDFVGVFLGTLPEERTFNVTVLRVAVQKKVVQVTAKSQVHARALALEKEQGPLGFGEPTINFSTGDVFEQKS